MSPKSKQVLNLIKKRFQFYKFERHVESKIRKKQRKHQTKGLTKRYESKFSTSSTNYKYNKNDDHSNLLLPENFDLQKNYDETIDFISDIRTIALANRRPVRLIFDKVKILKPTALLLLLAELFRCRAIHGHHKITGTYPTDKKIEKMLHSTGFFKLLGIKSRIHDTAKKYPLEHIEFITHQDELRGVSKKVRLALFGEDIQMGIQAIHGLTRAITEATLNVSHHAYNKKTKLHRSIIGRWWLAGHIDKLNGKLMIMFCDLGVGIPQTLPKKYPLEFINNILSLLPGIKPSDGEMIMAGMTIGRTRTGKLNRGKGLNDMRRFIADRNNGELHIFSRHGYYCYNGRTGTETINNFNKPIGGTLIQWILPLSSVLNQVDSKHED